MRTRNIAIVASIAVMLAGVVLIVRAFGSGELPVPLGPGLAVLFTGEILFYAGMSPYMKEAS